MSRAWVCLLALYACEHVMGWPACQPGSLSVVEQGRAVRGSGQRTDRRGAIEFAVSSALLIASSANAAQGLSVADVSVVKEGKEYKIKDVAGKKATLIVNVASQCALTPQYSELEELYEKYHGEGFAILAFPCNQFGSQEPEPVDIVRRNMRQRFGVQFPIFDKVDVNGEGTHPLYRALKSYEPELSGYSTKIAWNFEKFLLDSNVTPVRRYRPGNRVPQFESDVVSLLTTGILPTRAPPTLNTY